MSAPARRTGAVLLVLGLLTTAACADDRSDTAPPVAQSVQPTEAGPTRASRSPSPSPSPTPTAAPLSAFEDDPAVQGLRAFYVAAAEAVNSGNLALPALAERSTAKRQPVNRRGFEIDLGGFLPGPVPFTPTAVQVVSDTRRTVLACIVEDGWVLTAPGGTPVRPDKVVGAFFEMILEDGVWKVDSLGSDPDVSCAGVAIERRPAP